MVEFIQMVVNGIAVGSSYALMGLSMVIIYKTSEVPNFAQGEMALAVTYLNYMLLTQYGLPLYGALAGALVFFRAPGLCPGVFGSSPDQGTQCFGDDHHHHRHRNDPHGDGFVEIRGRAKDDSLSHFTL